MPEGESVAICRGDRGAIDGVTPAREQELDNSILRRYLCIHFPHKISSIASDIARLPVVVNALTKIIGPNVKMMQVHVVHQVRRQTGPGLAPG
jgi:phytanoyl-CoA hydroxylase